MTDDQNRIASPTPRPTAPIEMPGCGNSLPLIGPFILVFCLIYGCNIDWTGDGHTVVDPNPPGVVVAEPAFRLLIVEETADRPSLPASQLSVFTSTKLDAYLKSHCKPLADGSDGFRVVDKDDVANLPSEFRGVASSGPRESTPWLYVTNGKAGLSCPLPKSVDELMEKVKPYVEGGGSGEGK